MLFMTRDFYIYSGRERSPTNPEYDNFLFWKSPVVMDTEALEKEVII